MTATCREEINDAQLFWLKTAMAEVEDDCQVQACSLQSARLQICIHQAADGTKRTCLNKNTYAPDKCDKHVKELYLCCARMYKKNPKADFPACPIESAVKAKLDKLNVDYATAQKS